MLDDDPYGDYDLVDDEDEFDGFEFEGEGIFDIDDDEDDFPDEDLALIGDDDDAFYELESDGNVIDVDELKQDLDNFDEYLELEDEETIDDEGYDIDDDDIDIDDFDLYGDE
jgi:hypothetical protein